MASMHEKGQAAALAMSRNELHRVSSGIRATEQNDQQFCLEQVLGCDRRFGITRWYAPKQSVAAVMALYALLASLEKMLCEITDETVFLAKWQWWQQELLGKDSGNSIHPITRQLHRTGCIERWNRADLQDLLDGYARRRDPVAPIDEQQFIVQCEQTGRYPMALELQLGNDRVIPKTHEVLTSMAVTSGLFRLLRESTRGGSQGYWWLPMNSLAQFCISRRELLAGQNDDSSVLLLTRMMDIALAYHDRWQQELVGSGECEDEIRRWKRSHRHCLAQLLSMGRCLSRLRPMPVSRYRAEMMFNRPGDVWALWRSMRKLSI